MKIIKLTESDLVRIVKQVLSEQVVQGSGDDPWEYKKDGDKYYARKKGSKNWVLTGGNAKESIKTKIYGGSKTSSNNNKPSSSGGGIWDSYPCVSKKIGYTKVKTNKGESYQSKGDWLWNYYSDGTFTAKDSSGKVVKSGNYYCEGNVIKTSENAPTTNIVKNKVITNFNPIVVQKTDTFTPYSRDTLKSKWKFIFKSYQEASQMIGNVSKRTYEQLNEIKKNNPFNGGSFIIVNKDAAIASLFDGNFKFVSKSSIVTGKFKDTGAPIKTEKKWAQLTLNWAKKSPSNDEKKKILSYWEKNKNFLNSDGTINWDKVGNQRDYPLSYTQGKEEGTAITSPGLYKLGSGSKHRYAGDPDSINTFPLVDVKTGEMYNQAIHVYSDAQRGELIKKASSQDIESNKDFTRMGSGCVNVDKNFVDNIKKYNPQFIVILPDSGGKVDVTTVTMKTWTQKIMDIGDNCVKSLSNLF